MVLTLLKASKNESESCYSFALPLKSKLNLFSHELNLRKNHIFVKNVTIDVQ